MHETIFNGLEKSPMFQLSLASKELFHSNFLFWIWKLNPELFKKMIQELISDPDIGSDWPEDYVVAREHERYDLCVKNKGKTGKIHLVIENKVKSIPQRKQLEEYHRGDGCRHILLSLSTDFPGKETIDPGKETIEGWEIVNYDDLGRTLKELLKDDTLSVYHKTIIMDYADMIQHLHRAQLEWKVDENSDYFHRDNDCETLRINDLKEKIRFSKMLMMLWQRFFDEVDIEEPDLNTEIKHVFATQEKSVFMGCGMTRGMGLLEIKIRVENNIALLIQIQGEHYRHGVELYGANNGEEVNWQAVLQNPKLNWFFSNCNVEAPFRPFLNSESPLNIYPETGKCNHFGNQFLYQSIKIPANTKISELLDMIISDYKRIQK